jgi:hypothetical protein
MTAPAPTRARDRAFARKLVYLLLIAGLLMPLFLLSQPATQGTKSAPGQPGGKLARLREQYHLSQTELGQVDPTSETIRLATLGMRGVAEDILWWKANKFQMKKDWTNLRATLEQISKLQPHSIAVWRYQAWNLSYNVSVAFDDYHDKYYWVIEGIKFLERGVHYNEHEPQLCWDMGWFISQKIGRADESRLYRRLFKQDDQYHGARPMELRDNWLVGQEWYQEAARRVSPRHPIKSMAPVVFYSNGPMCRFSYAEALEKEGRFEEVAARAWKEAARQWYEFGAQEIEASEDLALRLNDQEQYEETARRAAAAIDKLAPGLRTKIGQEKYARLTPSERRAWETPLEKRIDAQHVLVNQIGPRLEVTNEEIARLVTGPPRREALALAGAARHADEMAVYVRRERSKVNFDYWRVRADMEQTKAALAARKAIYEADQAFHQGDLVTARAAYDRGLHGWRGLLDRYPALKDDVNTGEDLAQDIRQYEKCLAGFDLSLPKPFFLQDVLDKYGHRR